MTEDIVLLIIGSSFLFLIIFFYCYWVYSVLTFKCRICGKRIKGQVVRKIIRIRRPLLVRGSSFICLRCQKKIISVVSC